MNGLFDNAPASSPPEETRACTACKGSGEHVSPAFELDGKVWPERRSRCHSCDGTRVFAVPNYTEILAAIRGRKGLISKRPKDARAYYVWRMARFHGGADVTMPMGAMLECHGDPWTKELDVLADAVAKRVFGTDLAAAHRWGSALGHIKADDEMPGLPATAYQSGPVVGYGVSKPESEANEIDAPEDEDEEVEATTETAIRESRARHATNRGV